MSLASSDSLAQLKPQLDSLLGSGDGLETGKELFAALKIIDESGSLRRALTDPTTEAQARQALAEKVFSGHVGTTALEVLKALVGARWSHETALGDAVELVAVQAVATSAEREGLQGLQQLTEQLLDFNHLVDSSHEVQRALTDPQAPADKRGDLAVKLLGANARQDTQVLVRQSAEEPRGQKPADAVRTFADITSQQQRRWIADVTVAKPLQQAQEDRLQQSLSALFGRDLTLNVEVDPNLVGGIRVQVGDDVVDASIAARLNDLKTQLAG